jgi:Zn finger protein HypA/HybF involved in hydrogenase expression
MICPHCGGGDVEMISGRELEIRSMEIEDGDQTG